MSEEREYLKKVIVVIAEAAIRRVDDPKNMSKGDNWTMLSDDLLRHQQGEEELEFTDVVQKEHPWLEESIDSAYHEAGDQLAFIAMRLDSWEAAQ